MYLSRVFLQPQFLDNAYEWHRALWQLFPGIEHGNSAPFLFHMETINLSSGAKVLMQSNKEPLEDAANARILAKKPLSFSLHVNQTLRFKLQANPTKLIVDRVNRPGKRNRGKCRVPLIHEDEQIYWLQRKLEPAARVLEVVARKQQPIYFRRGRQVGKINPVSYEGIFQIQQPAEMLDLMRKGIGPAKAFGCGLLLVKRM